MESSPIARHFHAKTPGLLFAMPQEMTITRGSNNLESGNVWKAYDSLLTQIRTVRKFSNILVSIRTVLCPVRAP